MAISSTLLEVLIWVGLGVLALVFFLAVLFGGTWMVLGRAANQKEASARQRYPTALAIDGSASFFGQESRGVIQMRGNGTLILTDTELIFERWVPNTTFRVPLKSIQGIERPTSFLGKTRFAPLLKVVFSNEAMNPDSMAWQVRDLDGWVNRITAARR